MATDTGNILTYKWIIVVHIASEIGDTNSCCNGHGIGPGM